MEPPWPDVPAEWRLLSGQTDQSKTCCLHLSTSVVTDSVLPVMAAKVYPESPSSTDSKDVSTSLLSPPVQVSALGRHSTCPMLHRSPHGAETPAMIHHCSSAPLLISAHASTNLPYGTRNFFPTNGCVGETAGTARHHSVCCGHCPLNSQHVTALPGTVAHPGHLSLGHSYCAHTIPPQHWQCVNCLQQSMEVLCDPGNDARRVAEPDGHANNVWPNVPLPEVPNEMPRLTEVLAGRHTSPAASSVQADSLAPIGVFWDIENCHVPSGRSAMAVVQRLRETLFPGHREAEFLCVCDISKEKREVIQELNNSQVTVVHINATAKNSADDKLRQSLRRFAEMHVAPATAVLLSSDVNFASELSDLRHRHGFRVVLVHKAQASEALLQHAHTTLLYEDLVADLPLCPSPQPCHTLLYVHGLPGGRDPRQLGTRLRQLSENCGGKVLSVRGSRACLRFPSPVSACRAQKRLENEVVFGCHISAAFLPLDDDLGGMDKVGKAPEETDCANGHHQVGHGQSSGGEFDEKALAVGRSVLKTRSPRQPQRKGVRTANGSTPTSKGRRAGKEDTVAKNDLPNDGGNIPNTTSLAKRSRAVSDLQVKPSCVNQEQPSSRKLGPKNLMQSHDIFQTLPHAASVPTLDRDLAEQVDTRSKERAFHVGSPSAFFRPVGLLGRRQISTPPPLAVSAPVTPVSPCRTSWSPIPQMAGRHVPVSISPSVGLMTSWPALRNLRSQIVSVLQDSPNGCMPFYRFVDVFEKRFRRQVGVTELQLLRDCVAILELGKSCIVCLLPSSSHASPSPHPSPSHPSTPTSCDRSSTASTPEGLEFQEPFCKDHSPNADSRDRDLEVAYLHLGNVHLSLKTFAPQVHTLLHLHTGTVPLLSFPDCYCAEFGPLLERNMEEDEEGKEPHGLVPLEHLITCVPGVHVAMTTSGTKIIKWVQNRPTVLPPDSCELRCRSPAGSPLLVRFSREVVELLGAQPHCLLPFMQFIPTYHHHFGKQCRVTELGFSRLSELLDAVPHVVQILGFGSCRVLTLTHRTQIKRFTSHLLKLLKAQASKHICISDLPQAYHWCFSRSWDVTEYGVSEVVDLLSDVPEAMVSVCSQDGETYLSLPRKEQSVAERLHTRQFAQEAVQLLRTQPHFRMLFCKFIPHYHHHFGWQCRLAHYGFLKLQELFEAIPDVVQVLECGEERVLSLTETEQLKALEAHMSQLLQAAPQKRIALTHLGTAYNQTFGFPLHLPDYDASSLPELLSRIDHVVKIEEGEERLVVLRSRKPLQQLVIQLLLLLSGEPGKLGKPVLLTRLKQVYEQAFGRTIDPKEFGFFSLAEACKMMHHEIKVLYEDNVPTAVQLTPLFQFASRVRALLQTYHCQQLFLTEFPAAFEKFTGNAPVPTQYGYTSMDELILAISQVVCLKDKGKKAILVLKQELRVNLDSSWGSPTSVEVEKENEDEKVGELPRSSPCPELTSSSNPADAVTTFDNHGEALERRETAIPKDLLSAPLPPCLPSPQLTPRSNHTSESAGAAAPTEQEAAGVAHNRVSPAKRQSRPRVRLAACFSQAPEL